MSDEISDIANNIELGENRGKNATLQEEAYPGMAMKQHPTDDYAKKCADGYDCWGVLDIRPGYALDDSQASGAAVHITTEGYVAVFTDDPTEDKPAGTYLYPPANVAGYFSWTAGTIKEPFIKITEPVSNGDEVARGRIVG